MKGTPPTGRTIVLELVQEMEARLYPLLYRTVAPVVYHVYLHPDDYRDVEPVAPLIVADAQQALTARVEELNRRSRWRALLTEPRAPIEVPGSGWEVHVRPDANGELNRGALGIVSRLSLPAAPRFETGTPTTRIVRTVVTGSIRRSTEAQEPAAPAAPAGTRAAASDAALRPPPSGIETVAAAPPAGRTATIDGAQSSNAPTAAIVPTAAADRPAAVSDAPAGGYARLTYVDDQGQHAFVMRKDVVSIGRGGSAHWVDVQVVSSPRVSREHCRIRRDGDGRFFLQDISTWGTLVDGAAAPKFLRQSDGRVEETGEECELPRQARIQLADAVIIEFDAAQVR